MNQTNIFCVFRRSIHNPLLHQHFYHVAHHNFAGKLGVYWLYNNWLVVSTHLKNIGQNGNFPQIGMKISKKKMKPPPRQFFVTIDIILAWVMPKIVIHPGKFTWNKKNTQLKRKIMENHLNQKTSMTVGFQPFIFPGCINLYVYVTSPVSRA